MHVFYWEHRESGVTDDGMLLWPSLRTPWSRILDAYLTNRDDDGVIKLVPAPSPTCVRFENPEDPSEEFLYSGGLFEQAHRSGTFRNGELVLGSGYFVNSQCSSDGGGFADAVSDTLLILQQALPSLSIAVEVY